MTFISCFRDITAEIARDGIEAFDMRDQGHLEHVFVTGVAERPSIAAGERSVRFVGWRSTPRRLERSAEPTCLRGFVTFSTGASARCARFMLTICLWLRESLERRSSAETIRDSFMSFGTWWNFDESGWRHATSLPNLNKVVAAIERRNEKIVDPLDGLSPERYENELLDFGGVLEQAFNRVGEERKELEDGLLIKWQQASDREDGLILVDGSLRKPVSGAIGLVKSFTRQYVSGAEAATLFRLRHLERTAAFAVTDAWRDSTPIKAWYQRHWDATGRDPRHGLIRLEIYDGWADHPSIDCLADWVTRERLPTAKTDARWATLLYPVHLLEVMLKGQLDGQTRGWSSIV